MQKQERMRHPAFLIGTLVIAYLPAYLPPFLRRVGLNWGPEGPPAVILWNWLTIGLLAVAVAVGGGRGLGLTSLRRPSAKDLQWAVFFWGLANGATWALNLLFPPPPSDGLGVLLGLPLPVLVALIVTTATTEEILYKGYPIERLRALTGRAWPGVVLSFGVFVLPHLTFFGPQWLLYNGVNAVLNYALYLWRRNLWACMTMHLIGNALILIPASGIVG